MNSLITQLSQQFPDFRIDHKDAARALITKAGVDGVMEVEIMIHHQAPGGFSATRYEEGMDLGAGDLPHAWVTLRDGERNFIHHEVTCAPSRLQQLITEWCEEPEPAPATIRLKPAPAAIADSWDPATQPIIKQDIDPAMLGGLPDASAVAKQLQTDLANLDPMRVLQSWPRDERGRLAARTTAILAAYGPATRKRQPCLLIRSAMQSKMPGWELLLSQEFLYNQRHQWSDSPWLWTAQPAPPTSRLEQQARKLMSQGKVGEACDLCGVQLGEKVRRLSAGMSFQRFEPVNEAWPDELRMALRQLAPWRLSTGLQGIQQHLVQSNRKPPKLGSWERKLFWFSGQRSQVRWGLGAGLDAQGSPWLDLIATASNEHLPEPDWKNLV
ncbi:MAG: hypothetical protein LBJ15_01500 [Comamonas sp.]|jgi:hypothetical protein|uniref:hypothetical protein n=1 Tax=Comamonas sp. TaxID=34028 RepID=UPI00281B9028|nr:hypothetical protein [Comamonas sp.]MDR0212661.1 hypothetical protein [Comamonas sp.]